MEVRFRTARLRHFAQFEVAATREWGPVVGRRYADRTRVLQRTSNVHELYEMRALGSHPLTGGPAFRLTGQMRLIVSVHDEETITINAVADYPG